jgi:hypothetical protein
MTTAVPVRYPSGVTPAFPKQLLGQMGAFVNPDIILHWDDFLWTGTTGIKYTITAASGSAVSSAALPGGRVLLTTNALDNAFAGITLVTAPFRLSLGKRAWWATRLRYTEAVAGLSDVYFGLEQTTTTFATINDGLVFSKVEASNTLNLGVYDNSATPEATMAVSTAFAPATDYDIGFYLNEKGKLYSYFRPVSTGGLFGYDVDPTAARQATAGVQLVTANFNSTSLNPTFAVYTRDPANGAATLSVDLVIAAVER